MRTIHYREAFPLLIRLRNPAGIPTGVPDFDFDVRLICGRTAVDAGGRRGGELRNCRLADDGRLIVFVRDMDFEPGELICMITYHFPDEMMDEGERDIPMMYPTGITLTADRFHRHPLAEFEALLPYIKGADGEPGRDGSDAGISVIGFMEFVTDSNAYRVPVLKVPDIGPTDYYYYYSSGYIRIGDWDIDLESLTDESEVEPLNDIEDEDNSLL